MTNTNICPFCSNAVICDEDERPEEYCTCDCAATATRLQSAADKLFGDDCKEINPMYEPIEYNVLDMINSVIRLIAAGLIDKASLTLPNGEVAKINDKKVERQKKINAAVAQ